MLSEAQKKVIMRNIPEKAVISEVAFDITKVYANQFNYDRFPAVVLEYVNQSAFRGHWPILNNLMSLNDQRWDEKVRYSTGTLIYELDAPQPDELIEVVGTVSSVAHTFVIGDSGPGEVFLNVNRKIEFTGVTLPDADTMFLSTYKFRGVDIVKGNEVNDFLHVNIYAENFREKDEGLAGRTPRQLNGIIIADEIAKLIHLWFRYTEDIFDSDGNRVKVVLKAEEQIRNLDDLTEVEYRRRRQFGVAIGHIESTTETVGSIETVDWEYSNVYP